MRWVRPLDRSHLSEGSQPMTISKAPALTDSEIDRYSRQLLLKGWGEKQQLGLRQARIAISSKAKVAIRYLVGAGVGHIEIINDTFEPMGTEALMELRSINSEIELSILAAEGTSSAERLVIFSDEEVDERFRDRPALVVDKGSVSTTDRTIETPLFARSDSAFAESLAASIIILDITGSS